MVNLRDRRVVVTGGAGFLGQPLVKELTRAGADVYIPRSKEYDLRNAQETRLMLLRHRPEIVIHAAAFAGGIGLNQAKPAELFFDNISMGLNVMDQSYKLGFVEKYVQIGTICSYPNMTPVPFKEEDLWRGYPEITNAPYGVAKKALLVMAQAYRKQYGFNVIHLLPVNMYGPGDNFDPSSSHVVPALIRKFIEAKEKNLPEVIIWGDGTASREFLYVEDCAKAVVKATQLYDSPDPVNIGIGSEVTIAELALLIAQLVGYTGLIKYDTMKPNGQPRRCLDVQKAIERFNFKAKTKLETGLKKTIKWYLKNRE